MPRRAKTLLPEADRIVVSVNPKAGARSPADRVARLIRRLADRGLTATVLDDLDQVARQANVLHEQGRLRALVGVGGDGTAAELVNRTASGVPLVMLPGGNENLLARYVGWHRDPDQLDTTLTDGLRVQLDAARAGQRIFLLMIGVGFDAEVVRQVHAGRTGHIRSRNYVKPILRTIRSYQYPPLSVYWDQQVEAQESTQRGQIHVFGQSPTSTAMPDRPKNGPDPDVVRLLFAFNLPCYGGGLRLARDADGTDGQLDVRAFARGSRWHAARYAVAVLTGRHERLADCLVRRFARMRITSADQDVPYQLDGDPGGVLPVDVEVLPERLTLVVPPSFAAGAGFAID